MREKSIHVAIAIALCVLVVALGLWLGRPAAVAGGARPLAQHGELDLSGWNWERDGAVALDGQWEFYWQQLLTPADFGGAQPASAADWIDVPGAWNGHVAQGRELGGTGYATFRARVILPESGPPLAVHIQYESTAYRLRVNGRMVLANGAVGTDPPHSRPQYLPLHVTLPSDQRVLDLVMQVSNFDHRRGGLWNSILLGPERTVDDLDTRKVVGSAALFGGLLAAGLYHLLVYRLRTGSVASLYFGLLALTMAVRTIVTQELLLVRMLPQFPWRLLLTAEYLALDVGMPLFFLFLRALFPDDVPRLLTRASAWAGGLLATRTLLLPMTLASHLIFVDQIASLLFGTAALAVLGLAVRRRRDNALLFLASCALWLGTIVNDILFDTDAPSLGLELTPLGVLGFVAGMTVILADRHTVAYQMQAELAVHNTELAGRLKRHLDELQEARQVLTSQDEKLRKQIAEALHGRVQNKLLLIRLQLARIRNLLGSDPQSADAELVEVVTRLESLREEDIRQLSHLLHPAIVAIGLVPAVEALAEEYADSLTVHLRVDPNLRRLDDPAEGRIPEFVRLTIYRVLAEALQNALRHGGARNVTVTLELSGAEKISVHVRDDGRGFNPNRVKIGLGLQTIIARITESDGSWLLRSAVGEGTTLTFTIPLDLAHQSSE